AWRTTCSSSTRASRCRCTSRASAGSTSLRAQSLSLRASPSTASSTLPLADRRLHSRSARVRLVDRAASAGVGPRLRARAPPPQLPGLHAPPRRPGGRRAVRRRRRDGPARRRRRGRARGRLRRRPRAPRRGALAAGPAAHAGRARGARGGAAADAALRPLRGLRRADRHASLLRRDLDRPVRPLRRRAARDGRARRRRAAPARGARERRLEPRRELLGGARGRARVPALHASGRLPRVARPGDPALGRPRPDRRLAARAEPRPERPVRDAYEVLGVPRDATLQEIRAAFVRRAETAEHQSADEIGELRFAYETLADPDRRSAYDAAGGNSSGQATATHDEPHDPDIWLGRAW